MNPERGSPSGEVVAEVYHKRHREYQEVLGRHRLGRLVDVVVKHGKIAQGRIRLEAGSHQKADLGIVFGHLPRFPLHPEDLTHQQLDAALGILTQHPWVVGVGK